MEHEFLFGIFHPEKQATFSDVSLLLEIFRWNDPKSRVPFTFQPGFTETFSLRKHSFLLALRRWGRFAFSNFTNITALFPLVSIDFP